MFTNSTGNTFRVRRKVRIVRFLILIIGLVAYVTIISLHPSSEYDPVSQSLVPSSHILTDMSFASSRHLLAVNSSDPNTQLQSPLKDHGNPSPLGAQSTMSSLQSTPNISCSPLAINNFPEDLFTNTQRKQGWAIIHCLVIVYTFIGLAIVCDEYFVSSLESICKRWDIQPDVAGATFMAAGSSAPELATTVIGVFIAKDDIGLGAVVGSADFNIMFVIAVTAFAAKSVIRLNWWPLTRDGIYYILCIIILAFVIYDGFVYWYESLFMLGAYILYCVLMYFNRSCEERVKKRVANVSPNSFLFYCCHPSFLHANSQNSQVYAPLHQLDLESNNDGDRLLRNGTHENGRKWKDGHDFKLEDLTRSAKGGHGYDDDSDDDAANNIVYQADNYGGGLVKGSGDDEADADDLKNPDEEEEGVFTFPKQASICKIFYWFLGLPLKAAFYISIPDCRQKRWELWYIVTFIMSCVWISILSYIMIWMITIVGYTLHVPDSVMGLTAVAFGSSIPDAVASILVVRSGEGDMAVSNAVGSNIFDILLCMGFPWFLKSIVAGQAVKVFSKGLLYAVLTLILNVLALLMTTHFMGWKLTIPYGCVLMVFYFAFLVVCVLYEYNIFGLMHPPECSHD